MLKCHSLTPLERDDLKKYLVFLILSLMILSFIPPVAYADNLGFIARGIGKTLSSVFQIPRSLLQNGAHAFPLGLVYGVIDGSLKTVTGALSGVFDIARGGAPYAKYALLCV